MTLSSILLWLSTQSTCDNDDYDNDDDDDDDNDDDDDDDDDLLTVEMIRQTFIVEVTLCSKILA